MAAGCFRDVECQALFRFSFHFKRDRVVAKVGEGNLALATHKGRHLFVGSEKTSGALPGQTTPVMARPAPLTIFCNALTPRL